MDTFCATEGYAEKALRELALQVPPGSDNQRPDAERALGRAGFTELNQLFFDLAEHADDFMPVRDEVAPHVQRARADGASHVDVDVRLPRVCAQTSVQFNELLDFAERLSADAVLRTPAPSVMVTRFRRWYLDQIHAQLEAGTPPRPDPQRLPQRDIDRVLDLAAREQVRISAVFETPVHNDYVSGGLALAGATGASYVRVVLIDDQYTTAQDLGLTASPPRPVAVTG